MPRAALSPMCDIQVSLPQELPRSHELGPKRIYEIIDVQSPMLRDGIWLDSLLFLSDGLLTHLTRTNSQKVTGSLYYVFNNLVVVLQVIVYPL